MKRDYVEVPYYFEGWFTISLPDTWEFHEDESILNVFSSIDPEGALQISFHAREDGTDKAGLAESVLARFIQQAGLRIDINSKVLIETDDYTVATAMGASGAGFTKVWCIIEDRRMLLVTYNSPKVTRELETADDIVHSIAFD